MAKPLAVRVLVVIEYPPSGRGYDTHVHPLPSWEQIEAAVRSLNHFCLPFFFIGLRDTYEGEDCLSVLGGPNGYAITAEVKELGWVQYCDPSHTGGPVDVWTSDQGFYPDERNVTYDVERVVRITRYYAEHGRLDRRCSGSRREVGSSAAHAVCRSSPAVKEPCMTRASIVQACVLFTCAFAVGKVHAQQTDAELRAEASRSLKKAATFYHDKVASHGGYVYYYSEDLQQRWGEGKASDDTIFVQPPGTPTVGAAYLKAYEATSDRYYLDAARATAEALVYGQLQSGGWTQTIHFGPAKRAGKYRNGKGGSWNASSLDDGQTQSALRLLMRVDRALEFKHAGIHDAALYGLTALLKAQFANGAFPQVWTGPVEAKPVVKARYPEHDWKREGRLKNYWDHYTLNDGLAGTVADALIEAHQIYRDEKYRTALEKLGDFLILAQMPDPQPAWCQQYDYAMAPIWARKFEPPAVTGWESQDVMETLIEIAQYTGKDKYLEPIPRALAYLKKSRLPDGRVARYYELRTNKPLYMDAQYQLTHDDSDVPSHYGWKQPARFEAIEQRLQNARRGTAPARPGPARKEDIHRIIQELDAEGRWVTTYAGERLVGQPNFKNGFRYLSSAVFSRNLETLSGWLSASK